MSTAKKPAGLLRSREVVRALPERRNRLLVVTGLGAPTWDCAAAGDHALTFPLWGAMGGACAVGLGLALAQPRRRVLVVTGDGEMLMGLGSLATLGAKRPGNLAIVVIDNERYGETGMQASHTGQGVDLAAVASACGFAEARIVRKRADFAGVRAAIHGKRGPLFYQVKVKPETAPLVMPPRDGGWLKHRFRQALLGKSAIA